jgi:hypothetical protein
MPPVKDVADATEEDAADAQCKECALIVRAGQRPLFDVE